MLRDDSAANRVERFLAAHPTGLVIVCVGSASVAGIVWLAQRCRDRPVTLLIGDLKGRNFAMATEADRRAALDFIQRGDVTVLNWYRTNRSSDGRSEAHLKVWAACDDTGTPLAFLVGSANLTTAGLYENIELMALADVSEHAYLSSTIQQLQDKSWNTKERLADLMEHGDAPDDRHPPRNRRSGSASATDNERAHAPSASAGCGPRVLAVASLAVGGAALLVRYGRRSHPAA